MCVGFTTVFSVRDIDNSEMSFQVTNQMGGAGEVHTGFWWEDPREGDHLEDLSLDGRIILKFIFKKWDGRAWTGLIWLRIGTNGGRL
jgi:hypothetical protein